MARILFARVSGMMRIARHFCGGLLTAAWLAMATMAHAASEVTVQSITTMDIGNVISATSGVTVFRVAPNGGVSVTSGSGIRTSTGNVASLVSLKCDSSSDCKNDNVYVRVGSIGATVGRAGTLSNFTIAMNTGAMSGSVSGTNPVSFTIKKLGANGAASFYVGGDFPIAGNDSSANSGVAGTAYYVYVGFSSPPTSGSTGGTAGAVVTRALGLTGTGALNFGWIAAPSAAGATGNVAIDSDNDGLAGRHLSGLFAFNTPVPSRVVMTASGEPGRQISISIPHSIVVTRSGASDTLVVTMSSNAGSTANLNSSSGLYSFGIGGSINVSNTTPTGLYNGSFLVSIAYN
jgi:hypothetical protein